MATAQTVDIPDPNLRAAIETTLGKASGATITVAEMGTLTFLDAIGRKVRVLTGLESATNLRNLFLLDNSISDLTPLAGLTNLRFLALQNNAVSDLTPVIGLTNLIFLGLQNNSVSALSPLVENTELGTKDTVNVMGNLLSYLSLHTHIPALQARGVEVLFDPRTPMTPEIVSGNDQSSIVGMALAQPFVVEVSDENGLAFEGVPVTFTVTKGGGSLQSEITMTDADGRAESLLMLGSDPGTNTVEVSVEGITETATFNAVAEMLEFDLSVPSGISLIHIPLRVRAVDGMPGTIESVSDLYTVLGGADRVIYLYTRDAVTQEWIGYFGDSDAGTRADRELTDDMGIVVLLISPTVVRLGGDALGRDGMSTITLNPGTNFVGLPLRDSRIMQVSDLFALDGIADNVLVIQLIADGEPKQVGPMDETGDIPITGGQSFILIAEESAPVAISGAGWSNVSGAGAAPSVGNADLHAPITAIKITDTTPILALSGSIVDQETGLNEPNLRLTVKNLSTGRAVTGMTKDEGAGYRLAVVDMETGRAAAVGDILEISVQASNPFIGVEPLRHTVTVEDVKQSLIQLSNLIAYEIPTETELLRNYPNPFNPETWIPYRLAEDAVVTLTIYDGTGHIVRTLDVGHQIAAVYESRSKAIYWDGRNHVGEQVASGVYFYHLSAGDYSATRKLVILK